MTNRPAPLHARRPERSPQVSENVLLQIGARIFDGSYGPGVRLPAERDLASELGASRVSVRAALQRLESWRLLDVLRGSGAAVRPRRYWSFAALPALVRSAVETGDTGMLSKVVRESLQLRRVLITDVVCNTPHRLRRGALDPARDELEQAHTHRADFRAFMAHDLEMNRRVLEAYELLSPLWLLNSMADAYVDLVDAFPVRLPIPPDYVSANLRVLHALEAGNRARARTLASAYLQRHDSQILQALGVG